MSNELINIKEIESEIRYWFIRTDSGEYFLTYLENEFIAIGWNAITLNDMNKLSDIQVKEKIANSYDFKLDSRSHRKKATDIYNKIKSFMWLKKGDIIFIPSVNSSMLAFGQVMDDAAYSVLPGEDGCENAKRRKIKWLTDQTSIESLDPTFFKIRKPMQAISEISKKHQYFIDSVIYDVYKKGNDSHFVLRVNTTNEINLLLLSEVLKGLYDVMSLVNEAFELNEDVDSGSIRINLQSPGLFNVKHLGAALALSASLLGSEGCKMSAQPQQTQNELGKIYDANKNKIDTIKNNMKSLEIKL